jgi:hypothetical protein
LLIELSVGLASRQTSAAGAARLHRLSFQIDSLFDIAAIIAKSRAASSVVQEITIEIGVAL